MFEEYEIELYWLFNILEDQYDYEKRIYSKFHIVQYYERFGNIEGAKAIPRMNKKQNSRLIKNMAADKEVKASFLLD